MKRKIARNTRLLSAAWVVLLAAFSMQTAVAQQASAPSSESASKGTLPASRPVVAHAASQQTGIDPAKVQQCLADLKPDKNVDQYREEALEYALVSPRKISAALKSSRMRGLYPTIHVLGIYRNEGTNEEARLNDMIYRNQIESGNWPYKEQVLTDSTGHQFYAGLVLRFDLGTLAGGEATLKALRASKIRNEVMEKVNTLYFERERLQIRYCAGNLPYRKRLVLKSRIREISGLLEGLVGHKRHDTSSKKP
jgi:hypothetical protein